jgi:hypothetical protein
MWGHRAQGLEVGRVEVVVNSLGAELEALRQSYTEGSRPGGPSDIALGRNGRERLNSHHK